MGDMKINVLNDFVSLHKTVPMAESEQTLATSSQNMSECV